MNGSIRIIRFVNCKISDLILGYSSTSSLTIMLCPRLSSDLPVILPHQDLCICWFSPIYKSLLIDFHLVSFLYSFTVFAQISPLQWGYNPPSSYLALFFSSALIIRYIVYLLVCLFFPLGCKLHEDENFHVFFPTVPGVY